MTVNGSASVSFIAGRKVDLQPSFRGTAGTAGTTFHAWVETVPSAVSASPSGGTGLTQTFTWTVSNPGGYAGIAEVQALFNTAVSGAWACYIRYDRASNLLYLRDDTGATWLGGFAPGSFLTASNSRCTISGSGASVSGSGTQLALTVPVTFQEGWAGVKNEYLNVYNLENLSSSWQTMGTWNVGSGGTQYTLTTAPSPSAGGSVTPGNGAYSSGSVVTVSATPASGYRFVNWTGAVADANAATTTVTMNAAQAVTANFSQAASALTITTTGLAAATVGANYVQNLTATGGTLPYTWSATPGSLPTGLTLSNGGVLSGIPVVATSSSVPVRVTDALNQSAETTLTFAASAANAVAAPSWVQSNLTYLPTVYDNSPATVLDLEKEKFAPNCPPDEQRIRPCYQRILRRLSDQGVSGVRVFLNACDGLENCGQPTGQVQWNPNGAHGRPFLQRVRDLFTDIKDAGIANVTLTFTHGPGGNSLWQAKPRSQVTSPNSRKDANGNPIPGDRLCSDTPDPVWFNALEPYGLDLVGNEARSIGFGENDEAYNCSPRNPYYVGVKNQLDLIDSVLATAADVQQGSRSFAPEWGVRVFELEFEQEVNFGAFTDTLRFLYDNAHADSGPPGSPPIVDILTNLRDRMFAHGFSRDDVTYSGQWTDASERPVDCDPAAGNCDENCLNVYGGYARGTNLYAIGAAIGGGLVGQPTGTTDGLNLRCGGVAGAPMIYTAYSNSQPRLIDAHIYPQTVGKGTPGSGIKRRLTFAT